MTRNSQAGSLDEIRLLLHALPGPDESAAARAAAHAQAIGGTAGSLGLLAGLGEWMAAWRGTYPPRLDRPRIVVYAGAHGVACAVGDAGPGVVERVAAIRGNAAAVNSLCRTHDVELRVYEMAVDRPAPDIRIAPALDDSGCAAAMAYGMTAVEDGLDAVGLAVIETEAAVSALALAWMLFSGAAGDWTDSPEAARAAADAIAAQNGMAGDPLDVIRRLGGHDLAALAGAIIAARMGRVPVILDGFAACAAAAALHRADPALLDHCIVADLAPGPGHRRLLDHLGKEPLLDLGIAGGEGCAAAVALGLLRSVAAIHGGAPTVP